MMSTIGIIPRLFVGLGQEELSYSTSTSERELMCFGRSTWLWHGCSLSQRGLFGDSGA
ncbi:hypothetical protein D3C75_742200 [compost metagenome]